MISRMARIKMNTRSLIKYLLEVFLLYLVIGLLSPLFSILVFSGYLKTSSVISLFAILSIALNVGIIYRLYSYIKKKSVPVLKKINIRYILLSIAGLPMIYIIGQALEFIDRHAMDSGSNQKLLDTFFENASQNLSSLLLFFISVGVLSPIIEELVFRQILLQDGMFNKSWANALLSSIIFSLAHSPNNLYLFLYYFLFGSILVYIRLKTKSVQYSAITHILWNSGIVILTILGIS